MRLFWKRRVLKQDTVNQDVIKACFSRFMAQRAHNLYQRGQLLGLEVKIAPVVCDEKFMGWGFVQGRTTAIGISPGVMFIEQDQCMTFTTICVLLHGVPSLWLESNTRGTWFATKKDVYSLSSFEEYQALPAGPEKDALTEILLKVHGEYRH